MALNLCFSCLNVLSNWVTGVCHHAWCRPEYGQHPSAVQVDTLKLSIPHRKDSQVLIQIMSAYVLSQIFTVCLLCIKHYAWHGIQQGTKKFIYSNPACLNWKFRKKALYKWLVLFISRKFNFYKIPHFLVKKQKKYEVAAPLFHLASFLLRHSMIWMFLFFLGGSFLCLPTKLPVPLPVFPLLNEWHHIVEQL